LKARNSEAEDIVKYRNNDIGHGFQLDEFSEAAVADRLTQQVERFVPLVRYMQGLMLVYLESRSISREQTKCVWRLLMHDNPLFPRDPMVRSRGTVMDTYDEREVYVHIAAPDEFLSLWPWAIFKASERGHEAIWFFDGVKNGNAIYKSILAPNETIADNLAAMEILKLLSV